MTRKWSDIKRSKDDPARAARVAARVDAELQKERDPMAILDDEPVGQYPESEPYDPEQDEPEPSEAYVYSFDLGDFTSTRKGRQTMLALIDRDGCHGDYAKVYVTFASRDEAAKAERAERAKRSRYEVAEVPAFAAEVGRVHRSDIKRNPV